MPHGGGGNYVILNEKNSRIGIVDDYSSNPCYIIDTDDDLGLSYCNDDGIATIFPALEILKLLQNTGLNISDFVDQLENPAINLDMVKLYGDALEGMVKSLWYDSIFIADVDFDYRSSYDIVSKDFFPFYIAFAAKLQGDDRDFDVIESEESANLDSSIEWIEDAHFYFAVPRYNVDGLKNACRALLNSTNQASIMSLKPFNIGRPNML